MDLLQMHRHMLNFQTTPIECIDVLQKGSLRPFWSSVSIPNAQLGQLDDPNIPYPASFAKINKYVCIYTPLVGQIVSELKFQGNQAKILVERQDKVGIKACGLIFRDWESISLKQVRWGCQ